MVATSGDPLLSADAVAVVRDRLLPLAHLVTPNLPEAGVLLGLPVAADPAGQADQARRLVDAGVRAALLTGGHLDADQLTDVFATAAGVVPLTHERIATRNTHGTGCTLSSAIAAQAALRGDTPASGVSLGAVEAARAYLAAALRAAADWRLSRTPEAGHGPVDHLVDMAAALGLRVH